MYIYLSDERSESGEHVLQHGDALVALQRVQQHLQRAAANTRAAFQVAARLERQIVIHSLLIIKITQVTSHIKIKYCVVELNCKIFTNCTRTTFTLENKISNSWFTQKIS